MKGCPYQSRCPPRYRYKIDRPGTGIESVSFGTVDLLDLKVTRSIDPEQGLKVLGVVIGKDRLSVTRSIDPEQGLKAGTCTIHRSPPGPHVTRSIDPEQGLKVLGVVIGKDRLSVTRSIDPEQGLKGSVTPLAIFPPTTVTRSIDPEQGLKETF